MTDLIRAPWTPGQVAALNEFQRRGGMHPFTCGGEQTPGSPILVAREDGWHCSDPYGEGCDYRQDWANAFMADPSTWPKPFADLRQATATGACIHPEGYDGECPCPPSCGCCKVAARTAPDNPATSSDTADSPALRDQYAALAFNAVAPALKAHDRWLPLTVRQAVADAVLAVRDREHAALKRAHVALAAQAGRDQATLARVRELGDFWFTSGAPGPTREAGRYILRALQPTASDGGPTVAEAAADGRTWPLEKEGE